MYTAELVNALNSHRCAVRELSGAGTARSSLAADSQPDTATWAASVARTPDNGLLLTRQCHAP